MYASEVFLSMSEVKLHLGDCLEFMKSMPDKSVDAVITDPPYGIGADESAAVAALARIRANGKSKAGRGWKYYGESQWDRTRPSKDYFDEILRVGKKVVIWGGNYFTDYLPPTMQWLIWDKGQRDFSLADFEIAWSSERRASRIFDLPRARALQDGKVHPTQKSVSLMKWCFEQIALAPLCAVFDPFMGSGTTGVACVQTGRNFIGCELDHEYFAIAEKRIADAQLQTRMNI